MKIIFGEDKGYSTLDNGELTELNNHQELIQEMLSNFGSYKLKTSKVTQDPEFSHRKNLCIIAKDGKGKLAEFVFNKYGIKYIKLNDRRVSSNVVNSKKEYLDLTADFTAKMISVNDSNYKNTALAAYTNAINYSTARIKKLESKEPKNEKEKMLIADEIEKRQQILKTQSYILSKVQKQLEELSERQ